jgi:hypothetical protein
MPRNRKRFGESSKLGTNDEFCVNSTQEKGPLSAAHAWIVKLEFYSVDSISKPQASSRGSGMYFEFLLRRAHSRKRVDRKY